MSIQVGVEAIFSPVVYIGLFTHQHRLANVFATLIGPHSPLVDRLLIALSHILRFDNLYIMLEWPSACYIVYSHQSVTVDLQIQTCMAESLCVKVHLSNLTYFHSSNVKASP